MKLSKDQLLTKINNLRNDAKFNCTNEDQLCNIESQIDYYENELYHVELTIVRSK